MRRILFLLCCVAAVGACNSDDEYDATVPTDMALVKGNGQAGDAGSALPESLTVLVTNLKGDPVEGVTVEWQVLTGGGTVSAPFTTTSATGVAQAVFTLGSFVGEQKAQALAGSLAGSPITFTVQARSAGGGGGGGGGDPALRLPAAR
jgi:hypothetical protein